MDSYTLPAIKRKTNLLILARGSPSAIGYVAYFVTFKIIII